MVDVEYGLSDSGATSHFIVEGAPVINVNRTDDPISIKLPDGSIIKSTHTCNLNIPWLPSQMTEAHVVPGLEHSSLISTKKFCDHGCKVVFDELECRVYHQGKLVLTGGRAKSTGMWKLPINPRARDNTVDSLDMPITGPKRCHLGHAPDSPRHQPVPASANALYTLPHKQQQLSYMHQCFSVRPSRQS